MNDLPKWLSYIEQCHPMTIDMGLERIREVGERCKLLNFSCPIVTVAGTNGKGSTVAFLSYLLQMAGLQVGTYTSPHVLRFNERIQINGVCVDDDTLCKTFSKIESYREQCPLTFFEFTTLAAFDIFRQHSPALDVLILEVGLGGRLDAVNVLNPNLAIITSISFDHEEYLGNTIERIALEKAGILRSQIPVILSNQAKVKTILEKINEYRNTLYIEGEDFDFAGGSQQRWQFKGNYTNLPIIDLPLNSVSLALAAYTILGNQYFLLPTLDEVIRGMQKIAMIGRFHNLEINGVKVIFDVAHNPGACTKVAEKLGHFQGKCLAVWASLKDKDLEGIAEPLIPLVNTWYVADLTGVQRSASAEKLFELLTKKKVNDIVVQESIEKAFNQALSISLPGDTILVFGSFYTVSKVYENITFTNKEFRNNGLLIQGWAG